MMNNFLFYCPIKELSRDIFVIYCPGRKKDSEHTIWQPFGGGKLYILGAGFHKKMTGGIIRPH